MTNVRDTSLLAYFNDVIPRLGEKQRVVLEEILKSEDITNTELSARLNLPINTITPRVFELREKKLVIEVRKRLCKETRKVVIAWTYNKDYDLEHSHLKESAKERIRKQRYQPSLI